MRHFLAQHYRDRLFIFSLVIAWLAVWFELHYEIAARLFEVSFLMALICWRKPSQMSVWLKAFLIIFTLNIAWVLFQGIWSDQSERAMIFTIWLSLFLYTHAIAFKIKRIPWFWIIMLVIIAKSAYIIISIIIGIKVFPYIGEGYWNNQNYVATLLGATLVSMMGYWLQRPLSKKSHYTLCLGTFLSFIALLLTGSRGALIAVLFCSFFGILRNNKRFIMASAILSIIFALTIYHVFPDLLHYWTARADTFRLQIWADSLALWKTSPWLGLGWRSEPMIMLPDGNFAQHPHNIWLGALYFGGVPALIFFIILMALVAYRLYHSHYLAAQLVYAFGLLISLVDVGWWMRPFHVEWAVLWLPTAWALSNRGEHAHHS